jgi:hypothetical protein
MYILVCSLFSYYYVPVNRSHNQKERSEPITSLLPHKVRVDLLLLCSQTLTEHVSLLLCCFVLMAKEKKTLLLKSGRKYETTAVSSSR